MTEDQLRAIEGRKWKGKQIYHVSTC